MTTALTDIEKNSVHYFFSTTLDQVSSKALGRALGIPQPCISQYRSKFRPCTMGLAVRLTIYLNITIEECLGHTALNRAKSWHLGGVEGFVEAENAITGLPIRPFLPRTWTTMRNLKTGPVEPVRLCDIMALGVAIENVAKPKGHKAQLIAAQSMEEDEEKVKKIASAKS